MNINTGFINSIPQFTAFPALPPSSLTGRVGLVPLPNKWSGHSPDELIHGKPREISPLGKIITDCEESYFLSCLKTIGKEGLLATMQRGQHSGEKPVQLMLKTLHLPFIQEAVYHFGKEILWEPITTSDLDLKRAFPDLFPKNLRSHTLPFIHYFFCQQKMAVDVGEYLLEQLSVDGFNVQLSEGPFSGLTPVHLAFLFGNASSITWIMQLSCWNAVNIPAGLGHYINLLPAYLLLLSRYPVGCIKSLPDSLLLRLFKEKVIQEGPYQGFRFFHAVAAFSDYACLFEMIQSFGAECLKEPVRSGPNVEKTVLSIIEEGQDRDKRAFLNCFSAISPQLQNFLLKRNQKMNVEKLQSVDILATPYFEKASAAIPKGDKSTFKALIKQMEIKYPNHFGSVLYHFLSVLYKIQATGEIGAWLQQYITFETHRSIFTSCEFFTHPLLQGQDVDQFILEKGRIGLTLPLMEGIFRGMHALHYAALFLPFETFRSFCDRLDEFQDCLYPITSGECLGLTIVHLAALGKDARNISYLMQKLGSGCMHQPARGGLYKGKTPAQLAAELDAQAVWVAPSVPQPDSAPSMPQPVIAPAPLPNPVPFNAQQWIAQKLKALKKNPLPLIDQFKDTGVANFSVYGDEFLFQTTPTVIFPTWKPEELRSFDKFPAGVLDDVAGAFFQLLVSMIQQHMGKEIINQNHFFVPVLVYRQEAHEVRAHILSAWISNLMIHGFPYNRTNKAVQSVKDMLGESPYRFEEGQIVMDLEGFEKLTQHMAKPGFNLIMMPKMPDPEPQEEVVRQITHVRHPRAPVTSAATGTDEPSSMKRSTPTADVNPPKRIRLTQSAPAPGGVDRRTALTDGAKTTHQGEDERISPPAKRQKQGKLENVSMGKTVEMPEIAIDGSDPAFFLKNLMKGALEGTLNNLKSAKARSALISQEPLPMPIAEKLVAVQPVETVRLLTDLKGYQTDALLKILSLSRQGVMPLLSLEMGLGKTYVFREWILQQMIAHKGGRHLIIVPASVKEQTRIVFQDCLSDIVQMLRDRRNDTRFSSEELSVFFKFPPVIVPSKKEMQAALQNEHAILIVNYEILDTLLECKGHDQLTSIVVDEAQRVHNDQSKTQNALVALTKAQKRSAQFRQLMVTATPFENDLTELWTLLSSSNPGLVPEESQKALTTGLQKIKENLTDSIAGKSIDTDLLINIYAHYHAFHQILKQLVIYKKTTDPQVIQDWNGKVPTRQDESPEVELAPEVLDALSQATQELIRNKSQLAFNAKSNAALIHTSLIGQSIKDDSSAVQQLYQDAETGDIEDVIAKSSFLKLLFAGEDPVLQRCYRENLKALVFVDHYATGRLIQIGAKRIHGKTVEFFNGQCSAEEKNRLTTWFEDTTEPRVFVLTPKAGGVGLNLPSARIVVDLSQDYNIAQHYQAVARAIRANNEGEVRVLRPLFKGSFYQAHVSAHQARKAQWMEFYFGNGSFESFLEAVVIETKIDCLNRRKNLELTLKDETAIRRALEMTAITSDQIESAIRLVAHPLAAPVRQAPNTLNPGDYFQIALPYGTSREDAILFAKAFQNPLAKPLIERFKSEKKKVEGNVHFTKEFFREDPSSVYARRVQQLIQFTRDNAQTELVGKDFEFRTDVQPPVFMAAEENQQEEGVYLYRKPLPYGGFHYEPLFAIRRINHADNVS